MSDVPRGDVTHGVLYCTVYCENAVRLYGFGLAAARLLIDARKFCQPQTPGNRLYHAVAGAPCSMGVLGTCTLECRETTGYPADAHMTWEHRTEGYGFTVL